MFAWLEINGVREVDIIDWYFIGKVEKESECQFGDEQYGIGIRE